MSDIAVLGSVAFNELDLFKVQPIDIDILGTTRDLTRYLDTLGVITKFPVRGGRGLQAKLKTGVMVEAEIAWPGTVSEQLLDLIRRDPATKVKGWEHGRLLFPSLNILYLLKMSHRFLRNSPHFLKTLQDISVMKYFGAVIEDAHKPLFKAREKQTYDYPHPNLNTTKSGFFQDEYKYDHDSLHIAVKHLDRPAYEYYKPDVNEVFTSKEMFFSVAEEIRLFGSLEESYVLALERRLIPNEFRVDPKESFYMALEKLATSISSGWFREYTWTNYYKLRSMYDASYVTKFETALANGIIRPFRS